MYDKWGIINDDASTKTYNQYDPINDCAKYTTRTRKFNCRCPRHHDNGDPETAFRLRSVPTFTRTSAELPTHANTAHSTVLVIFHSHMSILLTVPFSSNAIKCHSIRAIRHVLLSLECSNNGECKQQLQQPGLNRQIGFVSNAKVSE